MEHRYDKRFSTDHKTLIFKNGMPVAIGRIHNFSRGGLFVKTEAHLVDINQSLEIELIGRGNIRASGHHGDRPHCKALVMHKDSDGLGLMLREDCEETQRSFANFFAEEFESHRAAANLLPTPVIAQQALNAGNDLP